MLVQTMLRVIATRHYQRHRREAPSDSTSSASMRSTRTP